MIINNGSVFHKSRKALEVLLLSLGLVSSLAMLAKAALPPHSCELVFSTLLGSWNSIKCLLSSHLYVCIIINFMVILIAFSSHSPEKIEPQEQLIIEPEPVDVAKDLKEDVDESTMEATWRSIKGDGKAEEKKKKHLEKCETWDHMKVKPASLVEKSVVRGSNPKWKELRKSETFNESVAMRCRGGMIRRDPSSSLEEFNKQVEDFIKRFNDDMKLQRQESNQRFLDMVKNGSL